MQDIPIHRYKDLRPCLVTVHIGAYEETDNKAVREKAMLSLAGLFS